MTASNIHPHNRQPTTHKPTAYTPRPRPSPRADPLSVLVNEAMIASWIRQGLPSDPTSVQNGGILANSERWPLMVDPQLQGVVWIKEREAKNGLQVGRGRTTGRF